jgi:hypothetical protein
VDAGHGRIETRTYMVIRDVAWSQERHRIAETENESANDKETINSAHAKFIVEIIWLDHVTFALVAEFLNLIPLGDSPGFNRAATCIFAVMFDFCGKSDVSDRLPLTRLCSAGRPG